MKGFCPNKMGEFWILILVLFFLTNALDKAESVKVKLELKTFDEIFGEGWWDKGEAEDLKTPAPTNFGQNVHHQIDRQNTQLGQIEDNSTDQNPHLTQSNHSGQIEPNLTDQNPHLTQYNHSGQIEPNLTDQNPPFTESDHFGQIESNSTDQNPPLTESDHIDNAKNGEEQSQIMGEISSNKKIAEDERKRNIINKFLAIKDEFKQKGKYSTDKRIQIEDKIAKHLKVYRSKIYEWKKELGLSRKMHNFGKEKKERVHLVEKFEQKKAELTRDAFKNSYKNELDKAVAKELGLSVATIYRWKSELGQTTSNKYSHSEQKETMKRYYNIKDKNAKISDEKIVKILNIGRRTLCNWKKQFKRQQLHPNYAVDGHEENAASNFRIENSNLGNI